MKKNNVVYVLVFFGLFSYAVSFSPALAQQNQSVNAEKKHQFLPIALSYAGIGNFYGVAYSGNLSSDLQVQTGVTAGDISAAGFNLGYTKRNHPTDYLKFNFSLAHIAEISPESYFQRGTSTKLINPSADSEVRHYLQKSRLELISLSTAFGWLDYDWKLTTAFIDSTIEDYQNEDGRSIETPNLYITPFQQARLALQVGKPHYFGGKDANTADSTLSYSLEYAFNSSSSGYSGNSVLTLDGKYSFKLPANSMISLNAFRSGVVDIDKKPDDFDEVKDTFNIDCSLASSTDKIAECETFSDEIASYIASHNKYGTARPLGGAGYLHAYSEARFRAAHSSYFGVDYEISFSEKRAVPDFYSSLEVGFAADKQGELYDESKPSIGGGVKWNLGQVSILFFYANGDDSDFLTLTVRGSN